jgi:signal recognition particle receptor subunit alpha
VLGALHSYSGAVAMLDTFEILTTSGVVLWSRTYVPVGANIINSLIRDVFIEERIQPQSDDADHKPTYRKEGYTLKWTTAKDLGLIFVVRKQVPRVLFGRIFATDFLR